MIVLDTTVLVYATGSEHGLRGPCRRMIEAVEEFTHVRARRRGRVDAAELARAYADLLAPLLVVDADDLREGLRLFEEDATPGSSDAVRAAGRAGRRAAARAVRPVTAGPSG